MEVSQETVLELGDIMLAALASQEPTSLTSSPQDTPALVSAPTATTFSTSNVAAPMVPIVGGQTFKQPTSIVGGQTSKQPTITAVAGTEEYCHIEPKNMHSEDVTNLGDEKLLATKLQESKTAGTVEYCHTVPKKMQSIDVTNLGDEKLLAIKLLETKTAGKEEYCQTVPKNMHSKDVKNLGDEQLLTTKLQKTRRPS